MWKSLIIIGIAADMLPALAGCSTTANTELAQYKQAEHQSEVNGSVLRGNAAFGGWTKDAPGVRRLFTLDDLPPVSEETMNESKVVPMPAGAMPKVPEGFKAEMVISGLAVPRVIRAAPNGDLFVATSNANEVRVLRVTAGTANISANEIFATGLRQPYGIAFYPPGPDPQWVYVANVDGVVRFPYHNGDLKATGKAEPVIDHILWTHHWTRDIVFSPDGKQLLLSVGSGSNIALDMFPAPRVPGGLEGWRKTRALGAAWDTEERRATILSFDPDGKNEKTVATGMRNPSGITIQPGTGRLWAVVNERDGLGDNTPFEYATRVKTGGFYGWPWYYGGNHEDPRHKGARSDLKDSVTAPDVLIQPHSAPLQITFYDGDSFPAEYKGNAFVALHGSWDRSIRTGYKVVRLRFGADGEPTGEYEDFMTGFVVSDKEVWGRPVGVAVAKDGSLFVTEDGNGSIWRVSHTGGRPR